MNRNAQRMSVSQAMFMAGNNVDMAADMISYEERGARLQRLEYQQAAESVRIARAAAIGRPVVQRG